MDGEILIVSYWIICMMPMVVLWGDKYIAKKTEINPSISMCQDCQNGNNNDVRYKNRFAKTKHINR